MKRRLIDPDASLELRPEIIESLRAYLVSDRTGADTDEVFRGLGIDDTEGAKLPDGDFS